MGDSKRLIELVEIGFLSLSKQATTQSISKNIPKALFFPIG
jgi:hypothetical protein